MPEVDGVTTQGVSYVGQRPEWVEEGETLAEAVGVAAPAEEPTTDEPKPDAKADETKTEEAAPDPAPEAPKTEEPKPEVKAEEPKVEERPKRDRSEASLAAEAARLRRQNKALKEAADRQQEISRRLAAGESVEGLTSVPTPDRVQALEDKIEARDAVRRMQEHPVSQADPEFDKNLSALYAEFESEQPDVLDLSPAMAGKIIFAEYLTRQAAKPKAEPKAEAKPKAEPDTASKRVLGGGGTPAPRPGLGNISEMPQAEYELARLEQLGLEPDEATPPDVRAEWEKRRAA